MKKILILFLLAASLTLSAQTKWYIATAANGGSDTNGDGSVTYPWLTLKHAADTVTGANFDNDTIMVGVGTFSEPAQVVLGVKINIKGAGVTSIITSANALNPLLTASSASGNAVDGSQSISYLYFDGNLTALRGIYVNFRSNVSVHHCTVIDFVHNGIRFNGSNSNDFNVTPTNTIPVGNKIYDCIITNCTQATGASAVGLIRTDGQSGMEIYNNTLDQRDRAAGENMNCFGGYQNYGLKIYNNIWWRDDINGEWWNFFAELHYSHGGIEVYGNVFHGAACFDLSGTVSGTYGFGAKVYDNQFLAATTPVAGTNFLAFIDLESFDVENDIDIYRNYFKYPRLGILLNNIYTSSDNIRIYYNIFEGTGNSTNAYSSAIQVKSSWDDTDPIPISNLSILNNVITAAVASTAGVDVSMNGNITNTDIRNNIIYGVFANPIKFNTSVTPTITNLNINKNIFNGNTSTAINYNASITYTNRDDTGNLTSDPLFISASDFHLQSTSPAINTGIDVGLTTDYDGQVVNNPEIGAFEFFVPLKYVNKRMMLNAINSLDQRISNLEL